MKLKLLVIATLLISVFGFGQNAILSTDSPPIAEIGQTITVGFNYTAAIEGTYQIQLFKTDASGNIDYSKGTSLYFTGVMAAAATSAIKSTTFTIPSDFEISSSLPAGVVYKWFIKMGVGGTDYYTSNPVLNVVAAQVPDVSYKIVLDTPTPITVTAGQTVTLDFTYSAPTAVGGEFQLYKTDNDNIWGGAVAESLPISQSPSLAAGTDVKTSVTLTIPADLPVSSSLPAGLKYRVFGKLAAATNGGTDAYWSYPELIVVASLGIKNFNENGVKVFYNTASKCLVFFNVEESDMMICDSRGVRVKGFDVNGQLKSVDVSSFSTGLYIVKSKNGSAFKFVVN